MARIFSIACFAVVAGIFVSAIANKYCKIKCEDPFEEGVMYEHTMCTYPLPNPAQACVKPRSVGLDDAERKAIVQKHNELRRQVASGKESRGKPGPQPPAVNMPDLTWDTELETIAQRWANQCIWDHDKCSNVERFYVGQNMANRDSSGENDTSLEYLIQKWYDEVKNFDRRLVSNFQSTKEKTGHYTQMVWAETKKIGCGRIKYNIRSGVIRHFLVCNYGPGGNMLGDPVYKIKK